MAVRGGGETVSVGRMAMPPGCWSLSHIWREGRANFEALGGRGNEAGSVPWASDHTVLNGSTGDECRAPRIQSDNGATGKL